MQKGIKPFGVLLILMSVFAVLAIVSALFPSGGMRIGHNLFLHFPGPGDIIAPSRPGYADISHLTDLPGTEADTVIPVPVSAPPPEAGTTIAGTTTACEKDPAFNLTGNLPPGPATDDPAGEAGIRQQAVNLEYPPGNDTSLHAFFRSLVNAESNSPVRIIHYGDSQIENDRITSVFRNRLQSRFGGSGIGMFPVISPSPHSASIRIGHAGNWQRHTPLQRGNERSGHNRYGLLMSYTAASVNPEEASQTAASFTLRPSGTGFSRSRQMNQLSLYLGSGDLPFALELRTRQDIIDSLFFPAAGPLKRVSWTLPESAGEYSVIFSGEGTPEIYAVSLDDTAGVAVDNVPMRGSAGLEFSRTDPVILRQMMDELNVGLILLQFGVNVVPHITGDYTYYENSLLRQLLVLKSLRPGIGIVVVGVSDMSVRNPGGYYESWPNIELIRDAQRNAAFRAGFPFWDLFGAMGGKNSMPAWVAAEPPLGQADHTHFTFRGAGLVGEMLYNALMADFGKYLQSSRVERGEVLKEGL
jgi:hypothetical protein